MNTINVSYLVNAKTENNSKSNSILSPNDIINMTVKSKDDKVATLVSGKFSFNVKSSDVVGNIGDKVSFEVISANDSKIELKQLDLDTTKVTRSKISQKSSLEILEMFKNNNVMHKTDKYSTDEEELRDLKAQEVIRKIQSQLKYATNNTSDSAVRELLANGINLSKITLDILTSVMSEIDSRPIKEVTPEELTEITNNYLKENNISSEHFEEKATIIKEIKDSGLPATKDNIKLIENALEKVEDIQSSDDFTRFIKGDFVPSIENLYSRSFSGIQERADIDAEFLKAEDLYKNLADELNLAYNEDTKDLIKSFMANEIDVTAENVEKYREVKDRIENIDKKALIKSLINSIKTGEKLLETNLVDLASDEIETFDQETLTNNLETASTLKQITNENINFFIKNYDVLKIGDLKNVVKENKSLEVLENTANNVEYKKNVLQLMEKMTYDVAYRLAKNGIEIDTMTVTSALEEIKNMEMSAFSRAMQEFGAENDSSANAIMSQTFDNIGKFPQINGRVYSDILDEKISFNIDELTKSIDASRAINGYEIFETAVSGKWKDSFSKVSEQILPFLESLGLPATDKNFRSAEILIKNHMDITLENIKSVKEIDLKIDKLQETLHPRIVAKFLADGENPLTMDIDEVLSKIDSFNNIYGEDVKEKIANYLLEAEKSSDISEETLKAMKSIYKALNIIQKNNGASIGSLYKANHSLTIGNLLDSSKYFSETKNNKSKIDTTIGDEYTEIIENPNSIKNVVEQGLVQSYEKLLLDKLAEEATPEGLSSFIENSSDYKNEIIENVIDILKDFNKEINADMINDDNINIAMTKLESALSNTGVSLNFLAENNIPLTMENLFNFKEMIDNPFDISKKLKKALDDDVTLKSKFKELSEEDLKTNQQQGQLIDLAIGEVEEYEPANYDLITNKTSILGQLELYSSITKSDKNNFTQVPIKLPLSDEVTTLNMYVVNEDFESKDEQKIGFSLDTDMLGSISALAKFSENNISITISANREATQYLEDSKEELVTFFNELGYDNVEVAFDNKDLKSLITNDFI